MDNALLNEYQDRCIAYQQQIADLLAALEFANTSIGEMLNLCDRRIDGAKDYREYAKAKLHQDQIRAAIAKANGEARP